ncbi:MAG: hypothetical protein JWN70_4717, partial [Planctomycetaceae bacterium]|nr:hypothetical protein [Planctomycetaceae bacterium]
MTIFPKSELAVISIWAYPNRLYGHCKADKFPRG